MGAPKISQNTKKYLPYIAIGVILLILFFRTVFLQQIYFLDDLKIIYYPLEEEYARAQALGTLPLWSNYFGFGHPIFSWGQLGFFTPLHLILRALHVPSLTLLQISIVTYFGIGLLGMYWYQKIKGFSPALAIFSASLFAINGFTIGHLNHVNFYTSVMVVPYLLISLEYLFKKPSTASILATSASASIIAISGQPQVVVYSFIIASIISAINAIEKLYNANQNKISFISTRTGALLLSGAIAIAVASPALLPLFEFIPETERSAGLPIAELYEFSYPPEHTITMLLPYFFGDHSNYWGAKGFQELSAFAGIIPILATGASFIAIRKKKFRAQVITGILLMLIAITFATAKYSPVYTYLVEHHIITSLAVPGRFVYFFTTAIAILAPIGLVAIGTLKNKIATTTSALLFTFALIAIPFQYGLQSSDRIANRLQELISNNDPYLWMLAISTILFLAVLTLPQNKKQIQKALLASIILSIGTLIMYSWNYNPLTPTSNIQTSSEIKKTLTSYEQDNSIPARLYSSERIELDGTSIT